MKTLGIDLGTNSLGWAVLGDAGFEDAGVLIFEEGVNREQSDSIETPAAARRVKRMARRLRFRRKMRRRQVLKILIENKMCPLTMEEFKAWHSKDEIFPKDNRAFIDWLKSTDSDNPYKDRADAASGKVADEVLGRAIFHMSQRRGFKSSRKDQLDDDADTAGEAKAKANKNASDDDDGDGGASGKKTKDKELGDIKNSIAELDKELTAKGVTLGQLLCEKLRASADLIDRERIRKRFTGRKQYEQEWDVIAKAQGLSAVLAKQIGDALFHQRPLREQSHLVGKCPLEPKRNRAQIGHPDYELFRALSFVNNIRVVEDEADKWGDNFKTPLDAAERKVAVDFFVRKTPFTFGDLRKKLEKEKQFQRLKGAKFNYDDGLSLSPSKTTAALVDIFGDGADESAIQKAFDALTFFDDNDKLVAWAQKHFGFEKDKAEKFAKTRVPEGRASYSLHAVRKINRFLEKGIELSQAVFLAKMPDVVPDFDAREAAIIGSVAEANELYRENKRVAYRDMAVENRTGILSLEKRLRSWFSSLADDEALDFESLYFRAPNADASYATPSKEDQRALERGILPRVNLGMIRNPIAQRSMTMLRRLVNELRKTGAIDAGTRIHIELARDVNDRNHRLAIQLWQKSNEKKRDEARTALRQHIAEPTDDQILKYILWKEQGEQCLYTGKTIGIKDLLGGSFDIEHTLPRSRSGDNSQTNLTLCDANYNRNIKKGRTPRECPNYDEIDVRLRPWRENVERLAKVFFAKQKAAKRAPADNPEAKSKARQGMLAARYELDYWKDKVRTFEMKSDDLTPSFMNRQLVDTGVMTRHAVALLKAVYRDVYPVNGAATAFARKEWGVQNQDEAKNRDSHVHHAADAMVIAALDRKRFTAICTALKASDETKVREAANVPPPFKNFAQMTHDQTAKILVKHVTRHNELKETRYKSLRLSSPKKTKSNGTIRFASAAGSTVRGQLHNETFYGKIRKPGESTEICVIRQELNSTNFKAEAALEKIIDKGIRDRVKMIIADRIDWGENFKEAMDKGGFTMESGVPIKKVRVEATASNPKNLRQHAATPSKHDYKTPYWVQSAGGSNFRLAVYLERGGLDGARKPIFVAENLLDHAQGKIEVPDNAEFCGYILPGAMAIAVENEEELRQPHFGDLVAKRLYTVRKFDKKIILMQFHKEARRSCDLEAALKTSGKASRGSSSIDFEKPHELLLLNPQKAWRSFRFEGIHFKMNFNGTIEWFDK
jgi:Uncharacterized protein conserved in bacteria